MPTEPQLEANRLNANFSTGPRTESGKSTASRNALIFGLYTRQDYVKPDERDLYKDFCETLFAELNPEGLLEETLTAEITGASWRLRRCSAVEAELADYSERDPMLDESKQKTIRSVERARAAAHSLFHRGINQLRRLQTERVVKDQVHSGENTPVLIDTHQVIRVANENERNMHLMYKSRDLELASICKPAPAPVDDPAADAPAGPQTPRSAPCPCGSGEKYKRCCGRNAPPVLNRAA